MLQHILFVSFFCIHPTFFVVLTGLPACQRFLASNPWTKGIAVPIGFLTSVGEFLANEFKKKHCTRQNANGRTNLVRGNEGPQLELEVYNDKDNYKGPETDCQR